MIRQGTEMVRGRVPVIAGVLHHSVETAAALSRFAGDCGADFVQALVQNLPWGGPPQSTEVLRYFRLLGDRTPKS
ncbi:MAG: hypothetical protein HY652_00295 [Acidobacteria bacterium]|nr:hypothetical protein [Acidobacteriota bacterium]